VENLYFHNSHLRGPKPLAPAATILPTVQMHYPLTSSPSPPSIGPSFEVGLANTAPTQQIAYGSTTVVTTSNEDAPVNQVLQAVAASSPHNLSPAPQTSSIPTLQGKPLEDPQVTPPSTEAPPVPSSVSLQIQDSTLTPMAPNPQNTTPATSTPMPTPSTLPSKPAQPASSSDSTSTSSHYPTLKPPRTRNNKHPAGPKGAHQNLTTKDMMDFASTSNLTYDSFWSNHSASIPSSSRTGAGPAWPGLVTSTPISTSIIPTAPSSITTTPATATTVRTSGLTMPMFAQTFNNNHHPLFTTGVDLTSFTYPSLTFAPLPTTVDQSRTQQ